jgi:hypothetical protein
MAAKLASPAGPQRGSEQTTAADGGTGEEEQPRELPVSAANGLGPHGDDGEDRGSDGGVRAGQENSPVGSASGETKQRKDATSPPAFRSAATKDGPVTRSKSSQELLPRGT